MPTLTGIFCRLCKNDNNYYVQATPQKAAHCLSCAGVMGRAFTSEGNMVALWILSAAVLALVTLALCCARGLPTQMHARRRRLQKLLARLWRRAAREYTVLNKLKILIGFYQIVTQVERIYDVYLPAEVRALLQFFELFISFGLEGVPLACVGAVGFHRKLLYWMFAPLVAFVVAILAIHVHTWVNMRYRRQPPPKSSHFERALPIFLRVTFLAYPMVTSIAFEAFSCHVFDDGAGSWLVADVSVKCGTPEHSLIEWTAWVAIAMYPIGLFVTNALLLFTSRRAIVSKQPTRLSRALGFLYREYTPAMFFWELMEMARRFLLVGLFVIGPYSRGSLTQIGLATLTCMVFFFIQQNAEPFKKRSDNYVALAASFSLIGVFFCCVYLKISTLTELDQISVLLSVEQIDTYVFDTLPLTAILIACILGTLAVSSLLVAQHAAEDARRAMHEAHLAKARRLMAINKRRREVYATQLLTRKSGSDFHVFLSHTWDQVRARCLSCSSLSGHHHLPLTHISNTRLSQGQDEMRVVKQKLLEMMPDTSVFLDVDNLKEGAGGSQVDKSSAMLVFITERYLESRACARELFKAVLRRKPIITILEPKAKRGGITREQITNLITYGTYAQTVPVDSRQSTHGPSPDDLEVARVDWSAKWQLGGEVTNWGHDRPPSGAEILDALFEHPLIEWNRIGDLQDVTMRLIAERLLPATEYIRTFVRGEIGQTQVKLLPPFEERCFHLYCSPHNLGAEQLAEELHRLILSMMATNKSTSFNKTTLLVTTELDQLSSCDYMLLYLTSATWTSGASSAQYATEVLTALKAGVALLPVHEYPSALEADGVRKACEFDEFWRDDWTPKHLLQGEFNIYRKIAIPLKPGAWRQPGLMQITLKLAEGGSPRQPARGRPQLQRTMSMRDAHHKKSLRLEESGVVSVKICSASRLRCGSDFASMADPYVVVRLGEAEHSCRPCEDTLDPIWDDETLEFEVPRLADATTSELILIVHNHDPFRLEDDLGKASVPLARLADSDLLQYTEELSRQGTLTFSVAWRPCKVKPQVQQPRRFGASVKNLLGPKVEDSGDGGEDKDLNKGLSSQATSRWALLRKTFTEPATSGGTSDNSHAVEDKNASKAPPPRASRWALVRKNLASAVGATADNEAEGLDKDEDDDSRTTFLAIPSDLQANTTFRSGPLSREISTTPPTSRMPTVRFAEANEEQTPRLSDRIYLAFGQLTDRVSRWSIPEAPAPASTPAEVSATTVSDGEEEPVIETQNADEVAQRSQREQIATLRRELTIPKKSKDAQVALIAADILGIDETGYETEADLLDACLLTVREVEQSHRDNGVVQTV